MLTQPDAQRNVIIGRIVNAVRGQSVTQNLSSHWIKLSIKMLNSHRVFRPQPAIAVSVPDNFANEVRSVRTPRMPCPGGRWITAEPAETHKGSAPAGFDWPSCGQSSSFCRCEPGTTSVFPAIGNANIRQVVANFQGEPRTRFSIRSRRSRACCPDAMQHSTAAVPRWPGE